MVDKFTATRHELALESEPTCYFDAQKHFLCVHSYTGGPGTRFVPRRSLHYIVFENHEDGFVPPGTLGCRTHTCEHTHDFLNKTKKTTRIIGILASTLSRAGCWLPLFFIRLEPEERHQDRRPERDQRTRRRLALVVGLEVTHDDFAPRVCVCARSSFFPVVFCDLLCGGTFGV